MKTKSIKRLFIVVEYLIILITIGATTYFAENQNWIWFIITLIVFAILEGLIKIRSFSPIDKYLNKREAEEFKLKTAFENYGIKDIYLMDNKEGVYGIDSRNKKIQYAIDSGNEFNLLAETGKSYIDDSIRKHWDHLKPKLDTGHNMKLLIVNPFSESKITRNKLNNIKTEIDPKLNLQRLDALNRQYENLVIKFTNDIYCSVFYTDNYLIYDPYHLGKTQNRLENYFLAFDFTAGSYGYRILKNHFEKSWENAMTFTEFKRKHDPTNILMPQ